MLSIPWLYASRAWKPTVWPKTSTPQTASSSLHDYYCGENKSKTLSGQQSLLAIRLWHYCAASNIYLHKLDSIYNLMLIGSHYPNFKPSLENVFFPQSDWHQCQFPIPLWFHFLLNNKTRFPIKGIPGIYLEILVSNVWNFPIYFLFLFSVCT